MRLSVIAAVGKNGELGNNNKLIWKFKGDLKFFKETTLGHTIVMGRKTFESLPKILPERKHIIISHQNITIPNIEIYHTIEDFLNQYKESNEEIFNIGGASIYNALLDYASKIYLTEIEDSAEADAYFPHFDKNSFTSQIISSEEDEKTGIKYKHVLYKRR